MKVLSEQKTKPEHQDWCFVSGEVSVAEVELLSRQFLIEILRCTDAEQIFSHLTKSRYRTVITSPADVHLIGTKVEEFFEQEIALLYPYIPDKTIANFFKFPEEVRKFREKLLNLTPPQRKETPLIIEDFCRTIPGNFWGSFAKSCNFHIQRLSQMSRREFSLFLDSLTLNALSIGWAQALPQGSISNAIKKYATYRLASLVARVLESGAKGEEIAAALTNTPLCENLPPNWEEQLCTVGEKLEVQLLHIFGIKEIKEEIESPEILEKVADDAATEILLQTKYEAFGPEKVFNYFWAIQIQNKNLRLCIGGTLGKLPSESVIEKLRREFV